jgi:transposase
MVIVGFDWARDKHDVCIQDPTGKVLHACTVAHDNAALEELATLIDRFDQDRSEVYVALEQHDGALLAWLLNTGFTVYAVNPKSADRARDVYRPAGGKDDRTDAQVVADLLRNNLRRFKPMHAQSEETLHLRSMARLRMQLMHEKTALMQRLRTLLAEWCPAVSRLCGDFNREWQRRLLERWPLHEDLAAAHGNSLNAFLAKARLPAATREKLHTVRKTVPIVIPEGRKRALRINIGALLEQLRVLIGTLAGIDQELSESFASHACFNVFHSLPVKGVPTLAMITAGFGDRRQDPTGWRKLAARWGVAPVTYASGKSRSVRRRKACDSQMLQALSDFAFTTAFSVSGCWARNFYDRKRRAGCDHHESLRAVALRWVKIMWRMWNDGTTYDEHYHRKRQGDQLLPWNQSG